MKNFLLGLMLGIAFVLVSLPVSAQDAALDAAFADDASSTSVRSNWKLGAKVGLNLTKISEQGTSTGKSPDFAVLAEYLLHRHFAPTAQLGYVQSRLPVSSGDLKVDFVRIGVNAAYRHPFGVFVPYIFAGPYLNYRLSSQFGEKSNGNLYSMNDFFKTLSAGVALGLGVELAFQNFDLYLHGAINRGFTTMMKDINSSPVTLKNFKENATQFYGGVKIPF